MSFVGGGMGGERAGGSEGGREKERYTKFMARHILFPKALSPSLFIVLRRSVGYMYIHCPLVRAITDLLYFQISL